MTRNEYNGWTNYETWVVKLWMDDDQGSDDFYRECAEHCVKVDGKEDAVSSLADLIKDQHEESYLEMLKGSNSESSIWSDLLGAAMSEVNWREIAEHYVEEVETEETTKE